MSLTRRSLLAAFWSAVDTFARQGLSFIFSMTLARLLSPEDFGTIGLLRLFLGISSCFVDSGFSAALIQRQDITQSDKSTVFWFNLVMGSLVSALLWTLAPALANFYRLPMLTSLTAVLSLNILINAAGSIHGVLLSKQLDFKSQMKIGIIALLVSGVVAIGLAIRGFGIWALAGQTLTYSGMITFLLWRFSRWRPSAIFDVQSARRLFGFGSHIFAANLLGALYENLSSLLIGKLYGVRDLGFFERAEGTKRLAVETLTHVMSSVAFPVFSEASYDRMKLLRGFRLAMQAVMLFNLPLMLSLAVAAEPLMTVLFGEQWAPAVPVFRALCAEAALWPLRVINVSVMLAGGRSDSYLRLESATVSVGCVLIVLGSSIGALGIALAQVGVCGISVMVSAFYTRKHLGYGLLSQMRDLTPIGAVSAVMTFVLVAANESLACAPACKLATLLITAMSTFLLLARWFRLAALMELGELLARNGSAAIRGRRKRHELL